MKVAMVIGMVAVGLFAMGLPALALDGPTPPQLADPVQAGTIAEIQVVDLGAPTAGTFNMYVDASCAWASGIAFDASAAAVQSAVNGTLGGCLGGAGTATVTGAAGGPWTISVAGTTPANLSTFVVDGAGLTGGTPEVHFIQDGAVLASDNVAPHGGYSALTDFCLQCHAVHRTGTSGEYALMAEASVTATCATCHGYLGDAPTGAENPGFEGIEGTTSRRAVYTAEPIHTIGATSSRAESNWAFSWSYLGAPGPLGPTNTTTTAPPTHRATAGTASAYGGGFYCGSCHTPHGDFGQLINSKWAVTTADQTGGTTPTRDPAVVRWENNTRIYWDDPATPAEDPAMRYLFYNAAPPGTEGWRVCTGLNGTGTCSYAQIRDSEGQLVSLYGYKLLSYTPNHQYPVYATGQGYLQANGTYGPLPPGGLYVDNGRTLGTLAQDAGQPTGSTATSGGNAGNCPIYGGSTYTNGPCPTLSTFSGLATLDADITSGATSFSVTGSGSTLGYIVSRNAIPFKIRVDDEVMMVTAVAGTGPYTLTVTRNTESPDVPWTAGVAAAHTGGTTVYRMPTILVNETQTTTPSRPFHITFGSGSPQNNEVAVVLARTLVSGSQFLYTIGRAVDGTQQNESHLAGATILQYGGGTSVATVKSWGADIYEHDMADWCGTCHSGQVDVKMGGQYHNHPTGCTACHGNPTDGSSSDFPHSSTSEVLLKEVPDALCIECHTAGTLP